MNLKERACIMKTIISSFILTLMFFNVTIGQDVTTVEAKSTDISENLDLEAVASLFGESEDLEDFEYKLNDPELKISNLDLNGDGYVDYLRVIEDSENRTVLITIQAILGKDIYQDVATIDVEKDNQGKTRVQVIGDVYMYGPDYIIEPVYIYSPPVVLHFWSPNYRPWYSPYYWYHYPEHYYAWQPYSCHVYRNNVYVHINVNHRYYYPGYRRSTTATHIHSRIGRNDYARRYPERSFSSRNTGIRNSNELRGRTNTQASAGRSVHTGRTSNTRDLNENRSNAYRSSNYERSSGTRNQTDNGSVSRTNTRNKQISNKNTNRGSGNRQLQGGTSHERNTQVKGTPGRQSSSGHSRSGQGQVKQSGSKQTVQSRKSSSGESSGQRSGNGNSNSNGKERSKRR
jgi:hypothetical protein